MSARKILIADDNRKLLQMLGWLLRQKGYEVICAQDGYQALQFALEKDPDLILLDINMPAGDGFSVQERLQKVGGKVAVPVVYLTGEKSDRVKRGVEELGGAALIQKPFELDELVKVIETTLGETYSKQERAA